MILTIDVKDSALDKILYFLNHLKSDVKIMKKIDTNSLDIETISQEDSEFHLLLDGRQERKKNPQNYGTLDDIDWT